MAAAISEPWDDLVSWQQGQIHTPGFPSPNTRWLQHGSSWFRSSASVYHLQDKSCSELPQRDVSNLQVSKTSRKSCICTTAAYSFSFCRENTAKCQAVSTVLTQVMHHFQGTQQSSLSLPYFYNSSTEEHRACGRIWAIKPFFFFFFYTLTILKKKKEIHSDSPAESHLVFLYQI